MLEIPFPLFVRNMISDNCCLFDPAADMAELYVEMANYSNLTLDDDMIGLEALQNRFGPASRQHELHDRRCGDEWQAHASDQRQSLPAKPQLRLQLRSLCG